MKEPILKGYFSDIFFEFLVHKDKKNTIIILPGFPSSNVMDEKIYFLHKKGFNVFIPRYKGTYQSKEEFLKSNPIIDLSNFVTKLKKGVAISLWDMRSTQFDTKQIFVFGESFGGSIACALAATSQDIKKAVIVAPVWDFKNHNKNHDEQNLRHLTEFVKKAFLNLYRYKFDSIDKEMEKFKEVSFEYYKNNLKIPVLVFHDPADKSVSIEHSRMAEKAIKNVKLIETNAGHGLSVKFLNEFHPQIETFLKSD